MNPFRPSALLVPLGALLMYGVLFLTHDMLIAFAEEMQNPAGAAQGGRHEFSSLQAWGSVAGTVLLLVGLYLATKSCCRQRQSLFALGASGLACGAILVGCSQVLNLRIFGQIAAAELITREMVLENIWPSGAILWLGFLVVVLSSIVISVASFTLKTDATNERRNGLYLVGYSISSLLLIVGTIYCALSATDFAAAVRAAALDPLAIAGPASAAFLGSFLLLAGLLACSLLTIIRCSWSNRSERSEIA